MQLGKARRTWTFCFCATLFGVVVCIANADQKKSTGPLADLQAACEKAKKEFRPLDASDVQQAKKELVESLDRLDSVLSKEGVNGENWRKYIQWESLNKAIRGDKEPSLTLLTRVYGLYSSGHEGLELVWFLDVQQSLHDYIAMRSSVGNPKIRAGFDQCVDRLAKSLESYAVKPNTEDALTISESVRWLAGAHQCPELRRTIEQRFGRTNVFAQISSDVVGAGLSDRVDDTTEVHDCILGTDVQGTAHTTGRTSAVTSPSAEVGIVDALFFGTTESENIGRHGPVTIWSRSTTELAARKRLWIDANGFSSHPAAASAETSIEIQDIQSNKGRRMIEKMAWRRAGKQQSQAECIASRRAEQRLSERIDQQAAESLEQANRAYVEKFQRPFVEHKIFPQSLCFSTTEHGLSVNVLQAGGGKTAAFDAPPPVIEGADMSLQIHESAINNLAFDALAGRTIYEEKMQAMVKDLLGRLPEKMKGDEDGKPWAITFAPRQPISVTFVDGGFKFTLRGVKYYKGVESYPAMNVSASYKIEPSSVGLARFRLVRQGGIEVLPPDFVPGGGRQIDARRQVIRTLLEKRFAKVFEPEFLAEGLELPGKWKAAGKMFPIQILCQDGWLVIGWKRAPVADPKANVAGN